MTGTLLNKKCMLCGGDLFLLSVDVEYFYENVSSAIVRAMCSNCYTEVEISGGEEVLKGLFGGGNDERRN